MADRYRGEDWCNHRINQLVSERDYLRRALKEAIEELESIANPDHMSPSKAKLHREWMTWLKLALPKEERNES